jgi:hypothetical protein
MQILMLRNTVVCQPGQPAGPVDAGATIDVDAPQAMQLIALGKAVAATALPQGDMLHADDPTAVRAEKRKRKGG